MTVQGGRSAAAGFFVTGTDTGVGKTRIACALVRALTAAGERTLGMKPVAAGAEIEGGRLVNGDVAALAAASAVEAPAALINPYCFEPAIAPHIAAEQAGTAISIDRIRRAFVELTGLATCVIVEGVGGFRVPLGTDSDTADLAKALGLPVILVVGVRLGCLNHALLTAEAVRHAGLPLAGWVANQIEPEMHCATENVEALAARLHAPLLARFEYNEHAEPLELASALQIQRLQVAGAG